MKKFYSPRKEMTINTLGNVVTNFQSISARIASNRLSKEKQTPSNQEDKVNDLLTPSSPILSQISEKMRTKASTERKISGEFNSSSKENFNKTTKKSTSSSGYTPLAPTSQSKDKIITSPTHIKSLSRDFPQTTHEILDRSSSPKLISSKSEISNLRTETESGSKAFRSSMNSFNGSNHEVQTTSKKKNMKNNRFLPENHLNMDILLQKAKLDQETNSNQQNLRTKSPQNEIKEDIKKRFLNEVNKKDQRLSPTRKSDIAPLSPKDKIFKPYQSIVSRLRNSNEKKRKWIDFKNPKAKFNFENMKTSDVELSFEGQDFPDDTKWGSKKYIEKQKSISSIHPKSLQTSNICSINNSTDDLHRDLEKLPVTEEYENQLEFEQPQAEEKAKKAGKGKKEIKSNCQPENKSGKILIMTDGTENDKVSDEHEKSETHEKNPILFEIIEKEINFFHYNFSDLISELQNAKLVKINLESYLKQDIGSSLSDLNIELNKLQFYTQSLKTQISTLNIKFQEKENFITDDDQNKIKNEELIKENADLSALNQELIKKVKNYESEIESLNQKLGEKNGEMETIASNRFSNITELEEKIRKYEIMAEEQVKREEENKNLNSQLSEINENLIKEIENMTKIMKENLSSNKDSHAHDKFSLRELIQIFVSEFERLKKENIILFEESRLLHTNIDEINKQFLKSEEEKQALIESTRSKSFLTQIQKLNEQYTEAYNQLLNERAANANILAKMNEMENTIASLELDKSKLEKEKEFLSPKKGLGSQSLVSDSPVTEALRESLKDSLNQQLKETGNKNNKSILSNMVKNGIQNASIMSFFDEDDQDD